MKTGAYRIEGKFTTPALVTVPMWFTVAAAKRVASAKGVAAVAVFDANGARTTVPVLALDATWDSKALAKCIGTAQVKSAAVEVRPWSSLSVAA